MNQKLDENLKGALVLIEKCYSQHRLPTDEELKVINQLLGSGKYNKEDIDSFYKNFDLLKQDKPISVKNSLILKTKAANAPFNLDEDYIDSDGIAEFNIPNKINKKNVNSFMRLDFSNIGNSLEEILIVPFSSENIKPAKHQVINGLSTFDAKVFQAACTLIEYSLNSIGGYDKYQELKSQGYKLAFTFQDVYRAMGYPGKRLKNEKLKGDISRSLARLFGAKVYYEWNDELEARHIDKDMAIDIYGKKVLIQEEATSILDGNFASIITPNNKKSDTPFNVDGFTIRDIPPLLTHAKLTGQIATIPIEWFKIKSMKLSDRRNTLLRGLSERIATAIYHKKNNRNPNENNYNVIVFDDFFKKLYIPVKNKQERSNLMKDTFDILNEFQFDKKIIKKYEVLEDQRHSNYIRGFKFYI